MVCVYVFVFKQKTAYEMRISDWSSDVCSSDLVAAIRFLGDRKHHVRVRKGCSSPVQKELRGVIASNEEMIIARFRHRQRALDSHPQVFTEGRSEERRLGKACVSTCRSRWTP